MFSGVNRRLSKVAGERGGWFTRADALESGYSDSEIRLRLRGGRWARLCRDATSSPANGPRTSNPGSGQGGSTSSWPEPLSSTWARGRRSAISRRPFCMAYRAGDWTWRGCI
ncbi:type IV toxin-antitoxin system AbiEi family antitoxin domain-containing protein [Kribbella alba]|uniref:type IV toxin-antitoxin system AbiEi family antitoxin domain-containing protein n=1 Tax=Kribbella alba TaxID=190197 RepID=UPI003CD0AF8F